MTDSIDGSSVRSALSAIDLQRARIHAHWNFDNPKGMTPAELKAIEGAICGLAQETTTLVVAFDRVSHAAKAPCSSA
jgi:hypothetical protein